MRTIHGADVVAFRGRRNLSRKALAQEAGLSEGKIWRIENKDTMSDAEEQALMMCGVTAVTMPEETPLLPRVDAGIVIEPDDDPNNHMSVPTLEEALGVPPELDVDAAAEPRTPPASAVEEGEVGFSSTTAISVAEPDLATLSQHVHERTFQRYISNSELQTFKRCRRKWWLAWNRGLHEKSETPIGVRQVGNRLHRALATHYVPDGPPNAIHLLAELEKLIAADHAIAEAQGWLANEELAKQFTKEADLERIMLEGYLEWLTQTGADADLKVIAPEAYLEAELPEFGDHVLAIIGKIDVRVRRTTDGAILFLDHKSVAEFTTVTKLLNIQEQPIHYQLLEVLSAQEGDHVRGALWNMMRRVKRTGTAKPPFYQRVEVQHNPIVLDNYRHRLVGEIQDILEVEENLAKWPAAHQRFAYPSPTRDCSWDCPFLQVCPMFDDGSRAEHMLEDRFTAGDPLDYYMTEMLGENE